MALHCLITMIPLSEGIGEDILTPRLPVCSGISDYPGFDTFLTGSLRVSRCQMVTMKQDIKIAVPSSSSAITSPNSLNRCNGKIGCNARTPEKKGDNNILREAINEGKKKTEQ